MGILLSILIHYFDLEGKLLSQNKPRGKQFKNEKIFKVYVSNAITSINISGQKNCSASIGSNYIKLGKSKVSFEFVFYTILEN